MFALRILQSSCANLLALSFRPKIFWFYFRIEIPGANGNAIFRILKRKTNWWSSKNFVTGNFLCIWLCSFNLRSFQLNDIISEINLTVLRICFAKLPNTVQETRDVTGPSRSHHAPNLHMFYNRSMTVTGSVHKRPKNKQFLFIHDQTLG